MAGPYGPAFLMVHHQGLAVCCGTLCLAYYLAFAVAQALSPENSVLHCFLNTKYPLGFTSHQLKQKNKGHYLGSNLYSGGERGI